MKLTYPLAVAALAAPLAAQDPCEGNGIAPNLYIETSTAVAGGLLTIDMGDPDQPFGLAILSYSDGWGPVFTPLFGTVCLDVFSPVYTVLAFGTDAIGNVQLQFPLNPALFGFPPLFADAANITAAQIAVSKTVPIYFELPDSYSITGDLIAPRGLHTATYLGQNDRDNRISVLVTGGGTGDIITPNAIDTTEIWNPLDRNMSAGPTMGVERAFHSASLLPDGRVLIAGGVQASGACTASAELYDPIAKTLSFTSAMSTPRAGHTATRLNDGKILVTGGVADYTNASSQFAVVLDTAQDTGEVFDPVTNTWTPVGNTMSSLRSGHTATLLNDGRVLLVSGINGGAPTGFGTDVPTFTTTCDFYDPITNTFSAAPSIPSARGFHGASRLGIGDVLVTGGTITAGAFGEAQATSSCYVFDGTAWSLTGSLAQQVAFHTQNATDDGRALITGGLLGTLSQLTGSNLNGVHDGATFVAGTNLGANPGLVGQPESPRGTHTTTRLHDGSYLIMGGSTADIFGGTIYDGGFVYTP